MRRAECKLQPGWKMKHSVSLHREIIRMQAQRSRHRTNIKSFAIRAKHSDHSSRRVWTPRIFLVIGSSALVSERTRQHSESARKRLHTGKAYADALERAGVKVHHVCHEHMIHHFYAMAGAIPYARTALKAVGADIKAAFSPVKALSAV